MLGLCVGAAPLLAQTSTTGALTGVVSDPSSAIIAGATVTATNLGTGEVRTVTTDATGDYKFSLLPPGNYSVRFSAAGFTTTTVPSVTVDVTETPVLNRTLTVGAQAQQVTVESTAETIQTQNATVGTLVGSREITALPLSTRNYTQMISLSPGVVNNVANAASFGNGTEDVNVNGSMSSQNNYQMDGASITSYAIGGAAAVSAYGSIAVPNPDSIAEFKIQTSQYDASYGRNPGANVNVVTKSGTNQFHGDVWEFNRNNFFNANDFFVKRSEIATGKPNQPQTLKQNQYGFTLGGPIKKDKLFFFGSYQGTRQLNGVVSQGSSSVDVPAINDYADLASGVCSDLRCTNNTAAYRAYLGSVFGVGGPENQGTVSGHGPAIAADGSNVSPVSIAILQAPGLKGGLNQGFFVAGAPSSCAAPCLITVEQPAVSNENQFVANSDYVISSKNTLSERYFFSNNPTIMSFLSSLPGAPTDIDFKNYDGVLRLTSILTNNSVNSARFSYNRALTTAVDEWSLNACDVGIIPQINNGAPCPAVSGASANMYRIPAISISGTPVSGYYNVGGFSFAGNSFTAANDALSQYQYADDFSWNHGRHSIRTGLELDRTQWIYALPSPGGFSMPTFGDFLYGGVGTISATSLSSRTPLSGTYESIRANTFSAYVQDDVKATKRLTVNIGVRWEYNGLPTNTTGYFSTVWPSLLSQVNTGSYFLNNPQGTLVGFVVQSNYPPQSFGFQSPSGATGIFVNSNKTLQNSAPWDVFSPRFGLAWQPFGSHLVVRGGYGWFHDRIYGQLLVKGLQGNPPADYPYPASELAGQTLANPWPVSFEGQACPGTGGVCPELGWAARTLASPLSIPGVQQNMPVPLVQEYNFDVQYELPHSWVVSVGYVGSHSVHLLDYNRQSNVDYIVEGAPNTPPGLFGEVPASALPFNDPANPTANWITTNLGPPASGTSVNQEERVPYLGLGPGGGYGITADDGDSIYNSLQAVIRHQFSKGLSFQAAYTWSKLMTDVDASTANGNVLSPGAASGYIPNLEQQYGLAAFNRPQRLIMSYSYDLPYRNTKGVEGKALGGWSISGVTTVQDGEAFTATDGYGGTLYGYSTTGGPSRAELANPGKCDAATGNCQSTVRFATSGGVEQRLNCYIAIVSAKCPGITAATAAFATFGSEPRAGGTPNPSPGPYTGTCTGASPQFLNCGTLFGNASVGVLSGPGQWNWDLALAKTTPVREGLQLQFRAEAFNVWNHTQFNNPGNSISSSTFGVITTDSVPPRILQFGLKLLF
jgi:hypothetical protein